MKGPARVLVVEDHNVLRDLFVSVLKNAPGLLVVGEAPDGLTAFQKAEELRPDLILLDIGLPLLNGIEVARRIRNVAPKSKILFVSENRSIAVVREAMRSGGSGYLVKSDCNEELLPAVFSVLQGNQYICRELSPFGAIVLQPDEIGR